MGKKVRVYEMSYLGGETLYVVENKNWCIKRIYEWDDKQCRRKRGYGKGKLYCKKHDSTEKE